MKMTIRRKRKGERTIQPRNQPVSQPVLKQVLGMQKTGFRICKKTGLGSADKKTGFFLQFQIGHSTNFKKFFGQKGNFFLVEKGHSFSRKGHCSEHHTFQTLRSRKPVRECNVRPDFPIGSFRPFRHYAGCRVPVRTCSPWWFWPARRFVVRG